LKSVYDTRMAGKLQSRGKSQRVRQRSGIRQLSAREQRELAALARLPDEAIDTSDIPELKNWSGAQRGRFHRKQ
jgi:hypothetical protein